MLGLFTVTAKPAPYVSACRLACNAEQLREDHPCKPLWKKFNNIPFYQRVELLECLKPHREVYDKCIKACPADEKLIRNPLLRR